MQAGQFPLFNPTMSGASSTNQNQGKATEHGQLQPAIPIVDQVTSLDAPPPSPKPRRPSWANFKVEKNKTLKELLDNVRKEIDEIKDAIRKSEISPRTAALAISRLEAIVVDVNRIKDGNFSLKRQQVYGNHAQASESSRTAYAKLGEAFQGNQADTDSSEYTSDAETEMLDVPKQSSHQADATTASDVELQSAIDFLGIDMPESMLSEVENMLSQLRQIDSQHGK